MNPIDGNVSPHPLLARGVALHEGGQFDQAADVYRTILTQCPADFDATHLLGIVALQRGEFDTAQRLIRAALATKPSDAVAMGNLGTSYMRDGQPAVALDWFEAALGLQPHSLVALVNWGTALHKMGRHREVIPRFHQAHASNPDSYTVANLLGACLIKCGEAAEAAVIFEAATRSAPGNAQGWANLAVALNATGRFEEAARCAAQAVALDPLSAAAFGALAAAQLEQGSTVEALESYRQAVALPTLSPQLHLEFANALLACGLNHEALDQLQRAVELDGDDLRARWAMVIAHLKPIYADGTDIETSRRDFSNALDAISKWYGGSDRIREPFHAVGVSQPFFLAYQPLDNRDLLRRYGAICASWMSTLPVNSTAAIPHPVMHGGSSTRNGKIRVGIATAHIHEHSVWNAITKGWVHHLNSHAFELHLFKLHPTSDRETDRAKLAAAHVEDQPTNLPAWVDAIRKSELDVILYPEIGMHPLTLQLAALRLAPLQAASWGHPETTGLPTMDLYLSADAMEPIGAESHYCEQLLRLPNLGVYVEEMTVTPSKPGLRSLNLPRDEPLLLCAGSPFKYSPLFDEVWVQIARQLPQRSFRRNSGGRLVFFRSRGDFMDKMLETRLRNAFDRADVDFDAHANIIPSLDRSRFFGLMRESALMLDTPGFSGFNTTLQGIQCDLPTLAYEGEFLRGRLASAIMRQLDLPELVAGTAQDFIQKAVELAGDAGLRKRVRAKIIERRARLFRDMGAIRALERHLTEAVMSARA